MRRISETSADFLLVTVTFFWGTTFIISKMLLVDVPLFSYLSLRHGIGALVMIAIAAPFFKELSFKLLRDGSIMGIFLFLSFYFQMKGIQITSASNAGFITGLNVVFVPIFSIILFRDTPKIPTVVGVAFALTGLFFIMGGNLSSFNRGDLLVLVCAVAVAFQVITTGRYAPRYNVYLLNAVQLTVTAVLSMIFMYVNNVPLPHFTFNITAGLVYLALFGSVYAFMMQTAMQRYTSATHAALIFTLEPVFAALFAYLIGGEIMTRTGWIGSGLILTGLIVSELNWQYVRSYLRSKAQLK